MIKESITRFVASKPGKVVVASVALLAPFLASAQSLFTPPSWSDLVASTTTNVTPVFITFVSLGLFFAGIFIGVMLVVAMKRAILGAASRVLGVRRGGGRRRRRR